MATIYHRSGDDYVIALNRNFIANACRAEIGTVPYDLGVDDPELQQRGFGEAHNCVTVKKDKLLELLRASADKFQANLDGTSKVLYLIETPQEEPEGDLKKILGPLPDRLPGPEPSKLYKEDAVGE